jgi:hypothetical protein
LPEDSIGFEGVPGTGGFSGHEFALAVATVVAALVVYALVRYAFVFAWAAVAALVAIQLFVPAVDSNPSVADRVDTLLVTGAVFLAVGLYADMLHARREAFWWHLVGLIALAFGFAYDVASGRSPGWIVVLLAGLVVLAASVALHRATWAIFGLLGTWAPIVHYCAAWFGNLGTAYALFVVGVVIGGAGIAIDRAGGSWRRRPPAASGAPASVAR